MRRPSHRLLVLLIAMSTTAGPAAAAAAASAARPAPADAVPGCPAARTATGWYESNPVYLDGRDDRADFEEVAPASVGLDAALLDAAARRYRKSAVQSILVLRDGKLAWERYLNGGSRDAANNLHSSSKTILGLLLGAAIDRGDIASLDTPLADLLPGAVGDPGDPRRAITLRHLATMSSGLRWHEDVSEYRIGRSSTDWVRSILDLGMDASPGTAWHYSTGNTHLLSAAIAAATGMSTCAFAHQALFGPLGISVEHWGVDPNGVFSGGYNLYLTAREMAKIGQLIANRGTWRGERLVSAEMVDTLAARSFGTDKQYGYERTYDYGTLTWLRTVAGHRISFAWGWGGQYIVQIPDERIVVVITQRTTDGTGGEEMPLDTFLERYLLPAIAG